MERILHILNNRSMSCSDRVILIYLERNYPRLMEGDYMYIQPWKVALEVGCSKRSVSRFLLAMKEGGYFSYQVKKKTGLVNGHMSWDAECILAELEGCKDAARINTKHTPGRKKERHKSHSRNAIVECDLCGNMELKNYAKYCEPCNHVIYPSMEVFSAKTRIIKRGQEQRGNAFPGNA